MRTLSRQPACIDIAQQHTSENVLTNCMRMSFSEDIHWCPEACNGACQAGETDHEWYIRVVASKLVNLGERLFSIAALTSCHQGSASSQERRSLDSADCPIDSCVWDVNITISTELQFVMDAVEMNHLQPHSGYLRNSCLSFIPTLLPLSASLQQSLSPCMLSVFPLLRAQGIILCLSG